MLTYITKYCFALSRYCILCRFYLTYQPTKLSLIMKTLVTFLLFIALFQMVNAQNFGVGTTSLHPKALLDVSSTAKGVLFPRMTTSQRFAIDDVPNGLMVYDTDKNEYYHFDGVSWRAILNGRYWTRQDPSQAVK